MIQGDFWLGYHLFDCCVSWIARIKMDQFSLGPVLLTRGSRWFFIHSRDKRGWGGESDMVIDGCKVILIVWWWMFGRTLTEADTWDKASHSCNRPATVSTPGNGAAPDDTHTNGGGGEKNNTEESVRPQKCKKKEKKKNNNYFEFELCCETYRRCQVQLVQICEACAPLQIWCLIDCPPAT